MFQMVDKDFDNDDNPYLEMKFRMTTLKDGVYEKIYIPLIKCENENLGDFQKSMWYWGQYYCPDFKNDTHYMYNNWFREHYSYYVIELNKCDRTKRWCKSDEEINAYLETTALSVLATKYRQNLIVDLDDPKPIVE